MIKRTALWLLKPNSVIGLFFRVLLVGISLAIGDYVLRDIAMWRVKASLIKELETVDFVAENFGSNLKTSPIIVIQNMFDVVSGKQNASQKFNAVLRWLETPPPGYPSILAWDLVNGQRHYYLYPIEKCGETICEFDPTKITETEAVDYRLYRDKPPEVNLAPVRWGVHKFDVYYWVRFSTYGEVLSAGVKILDWPRAWEKPWRALNNGGDWYRDDLFVYEKNAVLGAEYFEERF